MAKLKIVNLKKVQTRLRLKITKQLRSKEIRKGIAEIVVEDIQDKTYTASDATQSWRKYLEKGNETDPKYSRSKINITFTGELLGDLIKNVRAKFGGGKSEYIIEHSTGKGGKHKKYKKPNGKAPKGKAKTYKKISGYVQGLGYDYLKFSDKTQSKVIKFIRDRVFKNLK